MLSVSFQCREILTIPTIRNLRLLSGAEGLDRVVRWVYVAEAMENISMTLDWLIGDELVIITGSNLKENVTQELLRFIQRCNDKFVAGIVVNTGRYIPKLPPEAVALADDLHLPLFEVPWETKLVEFTKDIGAAIIDSSLEEESINAFMNDLLFGDIGGEENLLPRLARYGMEPNDKYSIGIINADFSEAARDYNSYNVKNYLWDLVGTSFEEYGVTKLLTNKKDRIIFLAKCDQRYRYLDQILSYVITVMSGRYPKLTLEIGVGRAFEGMENLLKSYQTAQQALKVLRIEKPDFPVMYYENIGLYSLLLSVREPSVLQNYYNNLFHALLEYDSSNHTELMRTLECYLNNNAKLAPTAHVLYIHENTLKYRLDKIKTLLGVNINDLHEQFRIKMGFMIGRVLAPPPDIPEIEIKHKIKNERFAI